MIGGILKYYMHINLELYRIFYTTAKLGSISKAAKELFTSQPAISQSIKQLEEKLGGILFYRNARGVCLTAEGEVLFRYIEQGYGMMQNAERKFLELRQMEEGQLRISVCSAVCKYDLLESIAQYNESYPNIKIHIRDESSREIARLLKVAEIDLGILNHSNMEENDLTVIKKMKVQDCFVASKKKYEALSKGSVSITKLARDYPFILLEKGGSTRKYIDEYFHSHEINVMPKIELSNLELITEFAVKGLGIACVARRYVEKELQSGELFEVNVEEKIPLRSLGIVSKKGMPLSAAAQKFIDIFIQETG